MSLKTINPVLLLLIIILLGAFLRFYKLDWGEGLFTHPDEYHIVISVNQLSFPNQMHPHFFSYGTAVIYLDYFTKLIFTNLSPFLINRFYSALFSTFTIIIFYLIGQIIFDRKLALVATFLVAITPGLIQQAHFATPESILTFFISTSLLFLLLFLKNSKLKFLFLSSICIGLGVGTKIVAGLFLPVLFLGLLLKFWRSPSKLIPFLLVSFLTSLLTFMVTSPFVFLDTLSWRGSFNYENTVARGAEVVFYTRQFIDTIPILFQMEKIFPYALGIPLSVFSLLGIIFLIFQLFTKFRLDLLIVFLTFLFIFLPNALLFAKWTRFIAPAFPFFSIFAAFTLQQLKGKFSFAGPILTSLLLIPTALMSLAFFNIYVNHDVRISADKWMQSAIPKNSLILVEGSNTIDLPLGSYQKKSIDFYGLEENRQIRNDIATALERSDYFIIQSRRVFLNHQRIPHLYPKTAQFYNSLFNGQLGFEQIQEFHSYPSLEIGNWKLEIPDEVAEETWSVFDHPVIRVFQKKVKLESGDYEKILEQ